MASTKKLKAISPNPTAVSVNASTSGIRLTLTFSSSSIFLNCNSTVAAGGHMDGEMHCLLIPTEATLVVGWTKAMLLHANATITLHTLRKKDLMVSKLRVGIKGGGKREDWEDI